MVIGYRLNSSDNSKNGEKNGRYCPHGLSTTYCTIYLTQASVQIEPQFSTCHWTPNHSQILQDSKFWALGEPKPTLPLSSLGYARIIALPISASTYSLWRKQRIYTRRLKVSWLPLKSTGR